MFVLVLKLCNTTLNKMLKAKKKIIIQIRETEPAGLDAVLQAPVGCTLGIWGNTEHKSKRGVGTPFSLALAFEALRTKASLITAWIHPPC